MTSIVSLKKIKTEEEDTTHFLSNCEDEFVDPILI